LDKQYKEHKDKEVMLLQSQAIERRRKRKKLMLKKCNQQIFLEEVARKSKNSKKLLKHSKS
jgi:hypothetical protein